MHTLKLIISIGLLSSYFVLGLVDDANADIFTMPNFYEHGAFTNDDFRPADDYFISDRVYYPDYTGTNIDGYYRESDQGACY